MATVQKYEPKWYEYLICFFYHGFILTALPKIVLWLLGVVIVPFALLLRKEVPYETNSVQKPEFEGWRYIRMPKLFWIWDNTEVGAMGDHTWPDNYPEFLKKFKYDSWIACFIWIHFRNPVNNLQQVIGQRLEENAIILYKGDVSVNDAYPKPLSGWHFVKCISGGKTTFSLYCVKQYGDSDKCLRIRIGYKVKPNVDVGKKIEKNDLIGTAFIIHPYKGFGNKSE